VTGWTLKTLKKYFESQLTDLRTALDERYATQTKATDAAFVAQQCCEASTPVLCADLVWRPAGELRPGDELIAFDAESDTGTGRSGRNFRRAVVTANRLAQDDLMLVRTAAGDVRCNPEHPWLVKTKHENRWLWRKTRDLRPGNQVMHVTDVWEVDRTWDGGWLSGMYDGEGWLTFAPGDRSARLGIAQAAGPTADALLMAVKDCLGRDPAITQVEAGRYHNKKLINRYQVSRRADVMKLLGSVRPARLLAHSDRVWEGHSISGDARAVTVHCVGQRARGTIASLSTSTGTYIAAGFAMHNTAMKTAFDAADKAVQAALAAAEKAASKAESAAGERFKATNEFRGQLADQAATLISRVEHAASYQAVADKIDALTERVSNLELRLTSRLDQSTGRQEGARASYSLLLAGVSILIALGSVLAIIFH
jgi:hypothetical protein